MPSDREVLLSLLRSLTLCDHMGDVSNEADRVLRRLGMECPPGVDWEEMGEWLGRQGVAYLYELPDAE